MLVFFNPKLVFLSMPKTGTTAYQKALGPMADLMISGPPALKHASLRRYQRFVRPMYSKLFNADMEVLAVIREPVSWLGSWYRYRQRPFLENHPNSTRGISFDAFVSAYCSDDPPEFARVGSQEHFFRTARNGRPVDHLFAYENQTGLQQFLNDRLGSLPDIPRCNVSPSADLTLDPSIEANLRKRNATAFRLYDEASR